MSTSRQLPKAVLETSFWTAAHRADVAANCFDLFSMVVPRAVETEIRSTQAEAPRREYPYATLFRHMRHLFIDPPVDAPPLIPLFGSGEAEAIALAHHLKVLLLMNETRAARHARGLGISVITVPSIVLVLLDQEIIGKRAAIRKLELLAPITAAEFINDAMKALERL